MRLLQSLVAIASIGAVAAATGAAFAEEPRADRRGAAKIEKMFDRLDANEDGAITPSEMEAARLQRFARADQDGDGEISLAEYRTRASERAAKRAERRFRSFDADGDGSITRDEAAQARRGFGVFERLDANGDGLVTRDEIKALR